VRCNHEPVTAADRLLSTFGVTLPAGVELEQPASVDVMAPFIVQAQHPVSDALGDVNVGMLGLLPALAQHISTAAQARHCRVETMKSDPTFRESWWSGRRCVVPVERLTEWCYASGRPGMWSVSRADEAPMGLAGLWNAWTSPTGEKVLSFCMLTINADGHAVFDRLKHPTHEKRMPVILPAQAQRQWLHGMGAQAERLLVRFPAEQLHAFALEPLRGPTKRTCSRTNGGPPRPTRHARSASSRGANRSMCPYRPPVTSLADEPQRFSKALMRVHNWALDSVVICIAPMQASSRCGRSRRSCTAFDRLLSTLSP
jgi:putative SOS response-associated peptidase YedK